MAGNPYSFSPNFPQDFTLVDSERQIMPAWQYFLMALYQKSGGSTPVTKGYYISLATNSVGQLVPFLFSSNGIAIGQVALTTPKLAPATQTLGTSPFVFQAPVSGFMTVPGGKVEYSRDGISYFEIGLAGGQIWILKGDFLRVSWFNPSGPPSPVVWWAGGGVQ